MPGIFWGEKGVGPIIKVIIEKPEEKDVKANAEIGDGINFICTKWPYFLVSR